MQRSRRRTKPQFWMVVIFVSLLAYALIADWWKDNSALGWTVVGVAIGLLAFSIYRFPVFRRWLFSTAKVAGERMVYETAATQREPMHRETRMKILQRARDRCERPDCRSDVRPHVHHIDGDHSNNNLRNLIALCPNCHTKAHHGVYSPSQLRNWRQSSWETCKRRRPRHQN